MVIAGTIDKNSQNKIPAVTHVDGSCRIQTVNRAENEEYYELIRAFGELTNCPVLTNTSFNDHNEPIVESYDDAMKCFLQTGLDFLYCDGFLVQRTHNTPTLDAGQNLSSTISLKNNEYTNLIHRFCDLPTYVNLANKLNKHE